jgi:hypothetical protein
VPPAIVDRREALPQAAKDRVKIKPNYYGNSTRLIFNKFYFKFSKIKNIFGTIQIFLFILKVT